MMEIRAERPMIASQSKICNDGGLNNSSSRIEPPVGFLNNRPLYNGIIPEL